MFKVLSIISGLLISTFIFSQEHDHSSHLDHTNMRIGENIEYCTTHKKMSKLLLDPVLAQKYRAAQNQLEIETQQNEQAVNLNKAGTIYKIPIVFHVLHNGGNENINRNQILDALSILNRDFRKQNSDANNVVSAFQGMPSDIEIEFVLASIAPNGQCFSGITRTQSPRTDDTDTDAYDGGDQIDAILAGNDVYQGTWSATKYLNIFVCKTIGGAAGYTYNPGIGTSMRYNSIFVLHNYTGSIGTSSTFTSRTLTHEVGHWLNLSHTWGPNNNPGNQASCNDDDFVSDTPNTKGVTSCNLSESSCGVLANVENYMDYSYCSKMFTAGQKTRMRTALTSSFSGRSNLWKTANLNATGANGTGAMCKADYTSDYSVICVGNSIDFTDASYHTPSGWNWTFQGGTPSSSTSQNPTITYNTPGIYPVSLTASNSGGSVSVTRTQYVKVLAETGIAPIQEGFEHTSSIPSNEWFINNIDNGISWELTNNAAASGNNSVMINNSQNTVGNIDELESTTITLDLNLSASISFDYAFAKKNSSNNDRLTVKVSNNCGQTWSTKKSLSGSVLETAPNTSGNFIPTETQWETATINSTSLVNYLDSDFRMKFIFESGGGNNLYLDNINISGPVTIEENKFLQNIELYPNPAQNEVNLNFVTQNNDDNFSIKVFDVVGKEIKSIHNGTLTSGEHHFLINTQNYQTGVYFISLNNGVNSRLQKLIIK